MAIPILNHLDFQKSAEIQNVLLHTEASGNVTSPGTGQIIYDSGTVKFYNGSSWVSVGTSSGSMSSFQLEDGDGTELAIDNAKEVKFIDGQGLQINWTDVSTGSDGDPYDMTFELDLANGISDVTPANGDKLLTLDSDGSTEQMSTVAALATLFAGSGLTATNSVIAVDTLNQNTTGSSGSVANALTFDDTTIQLNSGTTYDGSAARTVSAKTAAIANAGAALATADQIHTFVTTQTDAMAAGTSGNAATATLATNSTHVLVTDNEDTNEENAITFVEGATKNASGQVGLESDGTLTYNPSSGNVTATSFSGSLILDGNTISGIDDSAEFTDDDNHIMTSAAVQDKILGYSYITASSTDTLTNKTITSPDINGGTWNGTVDGNSTATGITWADLGSVTTIDINGGTINGITDLAIADGGTGQSTAAAAANALLNVSQGGALTVGDSSDTITVGGDLTVTGDLLVSGDTVTVNTETLSVEDPLIYLANGNGADTVDVGFYAKYTDSGAKYAGLFRDADDSDIWKLFATTGNSHAVPTTTVNTTSGFTLGHLELATLETTTLTIPDNAIAVGKIAAGALPSDVTINNDNWSGTDLAVTNGGTGASSLNNLITLTTHTTGDYVGTITASTGLTSSAATSGEGTTHSLTVDASQTQITAVGTIGTGTWEATDVAVAHGGTGASTLTDGGVLLGSGTGAITPMAVLADSEMIVGDGSGDPVAESGATLRTSIGVGTGDSPQFTAVNIGHASDTTLTRASAGVLAVEGANVYTVGGTDVAIADGGTGAGTASAAFTALKQDASATATGVVELATALEVQTGTDATRVVTPDTLAAKTVVGLIEKDNIDATELSAVIQHNLGTYALSVDAQYKSNTPEYENVIIDWECSSDGLAHDDDYLYVKFAAVPAYDITVQITSVKGGTAVTATYPS